eukprot:superscaffoldBa00003318_g16648
MVYFDCATAQPGMSGTECQKSCSTLDMACISTGCTSGCMCPDGLVSDGTGGCINETSCPCLHNGQVYQPGQTLTVGCNTCYCSGRKFTCTTNVCDEVCGIYGDGHYVTFDDKRFDFSGQCEYTLLQDYCGTGQGNGSFRIISENVPCGSTGTTCSKTIKIFVGDNEFQLKDENFQVVKGSSQVFPAQVHKMGIYLVVTIKPGLVLMWDQKTSLFIKLSPKFQGQVCGLCGNYDGNSKNDFTTRSQETVADVLQFGNSWKVSSSCPSAQLIDDPCASNRYRAAWSQKQCSIITSVTFTSCHSQVDPGPYFDSCVRDSCACDTGGDCECLCTAVAAYAKACNEAGACVKWRTPKLCPIFCDYYNSPDGCEWHYKPCGADCMKTCRNPSGNCSNLITSLEGCYPQCPPTQPYFDEDTMKCVAWGQCGCYDDKGTHYSIGDKVPSNNCYTCSCTVSGIRCNYNVNSCTCFINGKTYKYGATIYNTTDGLGHCIVAKCEANGTVTRNMYPCLTTTTPGPTTSPFTFSTAVITTSVKPTASMFTTTLCACNVNGTSYRPGDLVYNVTDGLGWCFVAYCNASCKVATQSSPCPTTPIPSTTARSTLFSTTTKASISTSVPPTTTIPTSTSTPSTTTLDCNDVYPPRKDGESWKVGNCTTATCANGKVTETPTPCPTVQQPICANGRKVVKVYDSNGCCFHYECECVCSVWGGSHYKTFDGKSYSFKENCSYYLVKEIITKYNLTIISNNHDCDPSDSTFCPQTLTVTYQSYKVALTQLKTSGTVANVVYVNQKRIYPAYSNSVLRLTSTDMVITLEIPQINTKVVYTGSSFSIDLPISLFGGNTEGQCVISPGSFVTSCVSDICNGGNNSCSSLEAYATECSNAGVCIDWRNDTNGQCEHKCPSNKVYMACGPDVEPTCNDRYNKKFQAESGASATHFKEGCFCPQGTTLFNTVYETCVTSCDCIGPDGKPRQPGDTWTSGCNTCVCDKDSMSVQCQPVHCPSVQSPICSKPGQQLVNKTDGCCTTQSCECNINLCPAPITCPLGFQLTVTNGTCCQSYKCVPKGVCVYDMTEYKGYEYQTVPGKCCGTCVQKSCIITTPDNTTHITEVNNTFVPPNDKCVKYTCEKVNGQLVTKETKTTCPPFNPLDCEPGTMTTDTNGCCKTCKLRSVCEVQSKQTVIEVNGCKSMQPVNMTSCAGHCGSSSMYSAAANMMMHLCECCQEATTSQRQVELTCADSSKVQHIYTIVEMCSCSKTECVQRTTPKSQRRRRR